MSDAGKISSRGQDPGADLVHLEGCTVIIYGLVESTGPGHVAAEQSGESLQPGSGRASDSVAPASSIACVEIWGNTVTINSILPHKGEVNADGPERRPRAGVDRYFRQA